MWLMEYQTQVLMLSQQALLPIAESLQPDMAYALLTEMVYEWVHGISIYYIMSDNR